MATLVAKHSVRFADSIASDVLAQKSQHHLRSGSTSNTKKRRRIPKLRPRAILDLKMPKWWRNLNKGLLVEFIIFLLFQGFNLFTNCWVLTKAFGVLESLEFYQNQPNVTSTNFTVPAPCVGIIWDREKIDFEASHFMRIIMLYSFFLALTSLIVTLHTMSWLYTMYLSMQKRELGQKGREVLIKMKLYFLLAASFLEDIPLSAITAELFAVQQGSKGITCWLCKVTGQCSNVKVLYSRLDASSQVIILNVSAIALTSLWKGISSFYRWSRIPNCEAFYIRACTSVFAGGLFIIVILTPAMTVLTYRYYVLPGVPGGLIKDLIDRVYIIGVIFWVMVLAALCCCPLLNLIRVAQ